MLRGVARWRRGSNRGANHSCARPSRKNARIASRWCIFDFGVRGLPTSRSYRTVTTPYSPTVIRHTAATYSEAISRVHCSGLLISGYCLASQWPALISSR